MKVCPECGLYIRSGQRRVAVAQVRDNSDYHLGKALLYIHAECWIKVAKRMSGPSTLREEMRDAFNKVQTTG